MSSEINTQEENRHVRERRLRAFQRRFDRMVFIDGGQINETGRRQVQVALPEQGPPLDCSIPPSLRNKIPPIYINYIDHQSWLAKLEIMETDGLHISPGSRAKQIEDRVRLMPQSMGDYKKIKKLCDINKWPHFTYGLPEQRRLKVVVKGLPADVDPDCIKKELEAMQVSRVHRMHTTPGLQRPALYMLVTSNTEIGRAVFSITELLGRPVTIERLVPKVGQCHRCQKWGHSQRFCQRPVKCVKCAGDHISSECRRDPAITPLKCANCFNEHTANYKKCLVAEEYAMKNLGKRSL